MSGNRPLSGICVIDFGQYVAGPAADMLNRGKICVRLDLKTEEGLQEAKRLIATSDVVIENFRPDVMDRLGLGSEAMSVLNPSLVYLSMPGFASSDAEHSTKQAWEAVIAGPTIASTLSRFGAEVLSIDPVEPTMDPWNSIIFGM
ncbi:MAG: CoA transferase [Cohaesibacter sp.]|nr:CoA transferase [Cohaesibacter sp.]